MKFVKPIIYSLLPEREDGIVGVSQVAGLVIMLLAGKPSLFTYWYTTPHHTSHILQPQVPRDHHFVYIWSDNLLKLSWLLGTGPVCVLPVGVVILVFCFDFVALFW